ncbi:MAG TPA: c-type cytochrome biogenesis protein CcmI [Aliiroseovarius sp.]|nr:c-type cytochrome biogenesis protein CcmI [Aliiroseovarius sp.]
MTFWLIAGGVTFLVVALIAAGLLRGQAAGAGADADGSDIQIYRDQLTEVERDLARGTLSPEEAERARTEISRRLLAADKAMQNEAGARKAPAGATWAAIAAVAAILVGGTAAVYFDLGANRPGTGLYPDMGLAKRIQMADELRANRPSQAEFEADLPAWAGPPPGTAPDYLNLIDKLRKAVEEHPGDLQGNQLLALHEARLGNYVAAHKAMQRVLEAKGAEATADDYSQYADLLVMAANGYVSPEAEAALKEALGRNPRDPVARYYTGLMFAQTGRPDRAFRLWRDLLEESRPDAPWAEPIRTQIGQLAAEAGVNYTPPAAGTRGPTGDQIASAQSMSPEERQAMIEGMVAQLSERLAGEGGTAQEWSQLIGALAVLGRTDQAQATWRAAEQAFADNPDDLAQVKSAAQRAGLDTSAQAAPPPEEETRLRALNDQATNLSDKLAREGGPASEWAQLIALLAELGEPDKARAIWTEAQTRFADNPADLDILRAAAVQAGVAE